MFNGKKSKISSIIFSFLFFLVVLCAVAIIIFAIRDLSKSEGDIIGGIIDDIVGDSTASEKSFSVEYNGKVLSDSDNIDLPESGQARFTASVDGGYTVQVLPNVTTSTDFNFYVDGVAHSYIKEKFTDYFVCSYNVSDGCFVINCSYERYTVGSVLGWYYSADNLSVNEKQIAYPFKLVVTSIKSGKSQSFGMKQINQEKSIKFDYDGDIVF